MSAYMCLIANLVISVGIFLCDSVTKRIICEKSAPTSDIRSQFVVISI